jgi:Na+-driven multidrug efflux pump
LQFEIGAGNLEKARKIFRISLGLVVVIALLGVLVLLFAGPLLYELWTRKALMPPTVMWNIFIVGIFFNAVWWVSAVVFQATNRPYDFAFAGVLSALLSLICSYFFSQIWGLTGAALGSLIMDLLLFVYVLPRSCMLVNQKLNILINDVYIDIVGFINKELNRRKYV